MSLRAARGARPRWLLLALLMASVVGCGVSESTAPATLRDAVSHSAENGPQAAAPTPGWDFDDASVAQRLLESVRYLASDELGGRGPNSEGLELAANYLAEQFKLIGLDTELYEGRPFQEFRRSKNTSPTDQCRLRFHGLDQAASKAGVPRVGHDFVPLSLGAEGSFDLPVVFAGYGITAPEYNYDDYASLDVTGKAVVVLRHEPRQQETDSLFAGAKNSEHALLHNKVENAILHGARAIVFCTDHHTVQKQGHERLLGYNVHGQNNQSGVAVLHCRREFVDRQLRHAGKPTLREIEQQIDETLLPFACELSEDLRLAGHVDIATTWRSFKNVLGVLPGTGDLAGEYVLVGAHYDHLGTGGSGSLAPWTRDIHNGADDNASGTSVLLEVARQLTCRQQASRRTIVFVAFSAEEMGLIGSEHYVRAPRFPLRESVTMINLDMVGRLRQNKLTVYGIGTAAEFPSLVNELGSEAGFQLQLISSGYGPSDHASFHALGIPVLHFFTGLHSDYHRPSDDTETLNLEGMTKISRLVADATDRIATSAARPRKPPPLLVANRRTRPRDTSPPGLGIQVTTWEEPAGLRIDGVSANSAAERAGLRTGDIIVQVDGAPAKAVEALREAVRRSRNEGTCKLVVDRYGVHFDILVDLKDDVPR